MVQSSVEYIDEEVEGGTASTEDDVDDPVSWAFSLGLRLMFPLLVTIFTILYLDSVLGEIRMENLYYPLFVLVTMSVLVASIYVHELRNVYEIKNSYDVTFKETLRGVYEEWWQAFVLVGLMFAYAYVIPIIGFFPATLIMMIVGMIVGGNRNPIIIAGTTILLLVLIYVLFIELASMTPPTGPLGV